MNMMLWAVRTASLLYMYARCGVVDSLVTLAILVTQAGHSRARCSLHRQP
jgi:hypothetical protein